MKKYNWFIAIFATFFVLNSCTTLNPPRMSILNTGNDSLFFFLSCESSINAPRKWSFPELWKMENGEHAGGGYADGFPELQKLGSAIESVIGIYGRYRSPRLPCENKEIHIFLFSRETVNSYTWEEIKAKNMFDKHMIFHEDSLKKLNWKLEISFD